MKLSELAPILMMIINVVFGFVIGYFKGAKFDKTDELIAENARLRNAIQRTLDDEESGEGWGPDITVCKYLEEALGGE